MPTTKIRRGINTGEVVRREGSHPFGQAVVVASKIASGADGEQVLVSDVINSVIYLDFLYRKSGSLSLSPVVLTT